MTINNDKNLRHKELEGVINCGAQGEYSRYVFEDEVLAQGFCHALFEEDISNYIRLETISLRDLVKEATL